MSKLDNLKNNKLTGLVYGNRILLPFRADILKVILDDEIIMDFSQVSEKAEYMKRDTFTELYLFEYEDISEQISDYDYIKMVVAEDGKDLFDISNHKKLLLKISSNHSFEISEPDDNVLFID